MTMTPQHPGAEDLFRDGVDQDCSGADGIDLDGDGFAAASVGGPDCDDNDPLFNPLAIDDVGDDMDQNCDGLDGVDRDQDGFASLSSTGTTATTAWIRLLWAPWTRWVISLITIAMA